MTAQTVIIDRQTVWVSFGLDDEGNSIGTCACRRWTHTGDMREVSDLGEHHVNTEHCTHRTGRMS